MIRWLWDRLVPVNAGTNSGHVGTIAEPRGSGLAVARRPIARWWNLAALGAIGASTLAMVLTLDATGLTGDEGFTAQMVRLPWSTMISDLGSIDYNMSAHYIALKAWTGLFGTTEIALRLLSVLFAMGSLILWHRLTTRLFGPRVAVVATVLLGLNPFFIEVGVTARPYAMLMLWVGVATFALVRALEHQTRRSWLWYALAVVIGLHVHLMASLVVAAHAAFTLVYQRRISRYNLEAAGFILVLGILPSILFLAPSDTLAWISPFSLPRAAVVGLAVSGGRILGPVVAALALVGAIRPRSGRSMKWLPSIALVTPILIVLALAPVQSLFVDFYFVVILGPLAVAAALGLESIMKARPKLIVPAGLALAGAGLTITLFTTGLGTEQGWRELPAMMADNVIDGDLVAFPNAYYRIVAEYYAVDPAAGPYPPADPTLPTAAWGTLRPYQLDFLKRTGGQASPEVYQEQALGNQRIWLVGRGDTLNRTADQYLEAQGFRLEEVVTSGDATAKLYVAG